MDPSQLANGASQFLFFTQINDFLRNEIDVFQWQLLQQTTLWVGGLALLLLTLWIMIQGYRTVTGQSREPMMALVGDSLKGVLIIGLATSMAAGSSQLMWSLTDGMSSAITGIVTGGDTDPFQAIDNNLAEMSLAMTTIDAFNSGGSDTAAAAKDRAMWFTGIGIAGPGVVAGAMLLLNKIAIALFIGFGPLFILSLMFKQTQSLFSKWLLYGIGTLFSLAVLTVMVNISTRMVGAVAAAFAAKYAAAQGLGIGETGEGINSMALQQGGIGLVMSVLMVMAPPMAAQLFQGTLASFAASSSFGQVGRWSTGQQDHGARPPNVGGQQPQPSNSRSQGDSQTRPTNTFATHTPPSGASNNQSAQSLDSIRQNAQLSREQQS